MRADDTPGSPALRAGDADRDALADALGRHYAEGRLDTDGLSERLDAVYAAQSRDEAAAVLRDLPALDSTAPRRRAGRHRHGESRRPQPGWIPTTERFRDPSSRRLMRVWIDPTDGSRHYLAE